MAQGAGTVLVTGDLGYIGSMLPMQRNPPPKKSFNLATGLPAK